MKFLRITDGSVKVSLTKKYYPDPIVLNQEMPGRSNGFTKEATISPEHYQIAKKLSVDKKILPVIFVERCTKTNCWRV